jgi:hypothetical protein
MYKTEANAANAVFQALEHLLIDSRETSYLIQILGKHLILYKYKNDEFSITS